jgi:Tfp pilus assembly protein PilV
MAQSRTNLNKNLKRQEGMSLIEVLVVLFFIGAMLTLYGAALNTMSLTKKLRYENYAYHIAGKKIEELRQIPVDSLPDSGIISDAMAQMLPQGSGNFTVSNYPTLTGLKEITVTVTWNDGASKQIQLRTLAGTGGINP